MAKKLTDQEPGLWQVRSRVLADALLRACLYLDGFVWLQDPEASEIEEIKSTVAEALGCDDWEHAMQLAHGHEQRRQG